MTKRRGRDRLHYNFALLNKEDVRKKTTTKKQQQQHR